MIALSDLLKIAEKIGNNTVYCALADGDRVVVSWDVDMASIQLVLDINVIDLLAEAGHLLVDKQRLRASRYPIDHDLPIKDQIVPLILTERVGSEYVNISFLMANPIDQPKLELAREVDSVRSHLQEIGASHRARLTVIEKVSTELLPSLLIDGVPKVLHFSGHGSIDSGVYLEQADGSSSVASVSFVKSIICEAGKSIGGVLLNCCYSDQIVDELSKYVDWIIGMQHAVSDDVAIDFARTFYGSLVLTKSAKSAFSISSASVKNKYKTDPPAVFLGNP